MGKFVISKSRGNSYYFSLKAGNGEIIAKSETYSSLDGCKNGIASVIKNSAADTEDQTVSGFEKLKNPKYEIFADKKGEFRFRLKAANGEVIASSEGYTAKSSCKNGIESVKKNAKDSETVVVE